MYDYMIRLLIKKPIMGKPQICIHIKQISMKILLTENIFFYILIGFTSANFYANLTRKERSLYSSKFYVPPKEAQLVVSITTYFRNVIQYCSGTLLTNRLVLTAAHCLYNENSSFPIRIVVRNEGWLLNAKEYIIKHDFIFLPEEKSGCSDMALVFLPIQVPGFIGLNGIKFAKLDTIELVREGKNAQIFALGYGINEFNRISLLPQKVPMRFFGVDSFCALRFLFSHSAISCSGDSGGPVLFLPTNGSSINGRKLPVYLGISTQIVIYDETDWEDSNWEREQAASFGAKNECQHAKELNVLQTFYIQNWLQMLIKYEKDDNRRKLYIDALISLVGQ